MTGTTRTTEDVSRLSGPKMEYYREVYRDIPIYAGGRLRGKRVAVYCEQGLGDAIHFARYVPDLMSRGCHVTLHCHPSLFRLFESSGIGDAWVPKDCPDLPPQDFHIPSMSLPFRGFRGSPAPYIRVDGREDLEPGFSVGVCWEGNPGHSNNLQRSLPLSMFRGIHDLPGTRLYMLHDRIGEPGLFDVGDDFRIFTTERDDFLDTARLLKSMDMVLTVDTSVLHLAGAMGVPNVFGMLSAVSDPRWAISEWYPNVVLLRDRRGDWGKVVSAAQAVAASKTTAKVLRKAICGGKRGVLVTGGVGDFLALDGHNHDDSPGTFYLASRVNSVLRTLVGVAYPGAEVVEIMSDYGRPFYEKRQVVEHLRSLGCPAPAWENVVDWSILSVFPDVPSGKVKYRGSRFADFASHPYELLPDGYAVVFPSTDTEAGTGRDFDAADWDGAVAWLRGRPGVVLGGRRVECPGGLINLSGQTTVLESVALLNTSSGYVGIDSFLSVLACQRFDPSRLRVKSRNRHYLDNTAIYCAPRDAFDFVVPAIRP